MQLSEHFKLEEFTRSSKAAALGLPNEPPAEGVELARVFCARVLERIRTRVGPVKITSGYRSPTVNIEAGGAATSDHVWDAFGVACDFQCKQPLEQVFDWIRLESGLPFDQVILERGREERHEFDDCIHISYRPVPRRMAKKGATHNKTPYQNMEVR